MPISARISQQFSDSAEFNQAIASLLVDAIDAAATRITESLLQDKKVLVCGNGGGAALAQYFAAMMINQLQSERPGLAAIALTSDNPTITSIASSHHFNHIYARQIYALGNEQDVLLVICSTGNSDNLLHAIAAARESRMRIIALCGGDGGKLIELLGENDIHIAVPSDQVTRIHETFLLTLHCICDAIDCHLLGVN
jgi:D-sedoheptulose 7-phosphate isomerase